MYIVYSFRISLRALVKIIKNKMFENVRKKIIKEYWYSGFCQGSQIGNVAMVSHQKICCVMNS